MNIITSILILLAAFWVLALVLMGLVAFLKTIILFPIELFRFITGKS